MRPDTTGSAEVSLGHVWRIKFKSHTHTQICYRAIELGNCKATKKIPTLVVSVIK